MLEASHNQGFGVYFPAGGRINGLGREGTLVMGCTSQQEGEDGWAGEGRFTCHGFLRAFDCLLATVDEQRLSLVD
jgi:hypothetical protein